MTQQGTVVLAYAAKDGRLLATKDPAHSALASAVWLDVFQPDISIAITLAGLGLDLPSLEDMEEIELSNRLYHEGDTDYLTIVVPGQTALNEQIAAPVTFILSPARLVTVRHHAPRPFETFPARAEKSGVGTESPDQLFTGLVQEIIGRLADHLEGIGKALDGVARMIYQLKGQSQSDLQGALVEIGQQGERLGRVRLALLTLGRALNHIEPVIARRSGPKELGKALRAGLRDIDSLEQHANFLDSRLALASDATLGTIDLAQNATVKTVSLVSVLFLPPTLIASVYGMNFTIMPELAHPLGYIWALALMVASAAITWAVFRWKGWL